MSHGVHAVQHEAEQQMEHEHGHGKHETEGRNKKIALLIAVLEGADAIRDHHREAVDLASEALQEARAGQAPAALTGYALGNPYRGGNPWSARG